LNRESHELQPWECQRRHEARPLTDHLADWREDMIARGKTARHADQYLERAGKLAALTRGARLTELEPGRKPESLRRAAERLAGILKAARLSDLAPKRIQAALATLRDSGKAHQTVNHDRAPSARSPAGRPTRAGPATTPCGACPASTPMRTCVTPDAA
jgi:hypothetical protein